MTAAVPEAVPSGPLTEFRLSAKHRPLKSFIWDRKVHP